MKDQHRTVALREFYDTLLEAQNAHMDAYTSTGSVNRQSLYYAFTVRKALNLLLMTDGDIEQYKSKLIELRKKYDHMRSKPTKIKGSRNKYKYCVDMVYGIIVQFEREVENYIPLYQITDEITNKQEFDKFFAKKKIEWGNSSSIVKHAMQQAWHQALMMVKYGDIDIKDI